MTVREPSPLLFGALHYTLNKHFDMDEIFSLLVADNPAEALPHRAFDDDVKHRSTFIFNFEYFTLIGDNCRPMPWQRADLLKGSTTHFPLSRCSAVVALLLEGNPIGKVQSRDRRHENKTGDVFDLFSPWRVLNLQAYPDLKSTVDVHDSAKKYLNGPEAFLITLRSEFSRRIQAANGCSRKDIRPGRATSGLHF